MEFKQLKIEIFKAEEIPDMDSINFFSKSEVKRNRKCQGYVEVKYTGIVKKTKIVDMKEEKIIWNECIQIPVSIPAVSQKIIMVIKDDDAGRDDVVGSIEIKMDDILHGNKYKEQVAVDIYGSSVNKLGGIYELMNYNAEIGSKWKGRLFIRIKVEDTDTPVLQVKSIDDNEYLNTIYQTGRKHMWSIYATLYNVSYLPKDTEYGFKISIQENNKYFQGKTAVNKMISWNITESIVINTFSD